MEISDQDLEQIYQHARNISKAIDQLMEENDDLLNRLSLFLPALSGADAAE